jgi:alpha/beta superfamily hydrolase
MLHGFASQRDEVGGLYARLAAALAERGVASLRIDFRGWGSSPGDMADTTVGGQLDDALSAYTWLERETPVDPARMGMLGFSLGGSIAMLASARLSQPPRALALWSATHDLRQSFLLEMSEETFAAAAQNEAVEVDLGWRMVTLKRTFFDSLTKHNPPAALATYQGALLVVAGSEDSSAHSLDILTDRAGSTQKETMLIPGADHIFNVLGDSQAISEALITKTADWFAVAL